MKNNILILTGGTGGHIIPAISLAEYFLKNSYNVTIFGDEKTKKYLKNDNIKFFAISSGSSLKSLKSIFRIIMGFLQSLLLLKKNKFDAVIGFGCYTTLPTLLACKFIKIPIFLHEGNAFIGRVNRLFSSSSINIFTSFQEIFGINYKDSSKIIFSGFIVREEVKQYYNRKYIKSDKIRILVTGGSGGASFFSKDFIKIFTYISKSIKSKIEVCHQVKSEDEISDVKYFYNNECIKNEVKLFFDDLPNKIFNSDLVICRSGIGTISEVSIIGRACIMVPSPNVANDHQNYNAKFFERSNACFLVDENSFSAENFAKNLEDIILNKLEFFANNIKSMANLDADKIIFNNVNNYINNNNHEKI